MSWFTGASDALEAEILKREMDRRQAMRDALKAKEQEEHAQDRKMNREIQRSNMESAAQARKAAEQASRAGIANQLADDLRIGQEVDDTTAADLRAGNRGGLIDPAREAAMRGQTGMAGLFGEAGGETGPGAVAPKTATFRGTAAQHELVRKSTADKAEAEARRAHDAEQKDLTRQGQKERDEALNAFKLSMAQLVASGKADSQAVSNELKRLEIAMKADKLETAQADRNKAKSLEQTQLDSALNLATELQNHPGLSKASGVISSRVSGLSQEATDFDALRDRLVAALAQPNLGSLKGPMSDKDIIFVQNLSTTLGNRRASDSVTKQALVKAAEFLRSRGAGVAAAPPGDSGFKVTEIK